MITFWYIISYRHSLTLSEKIREQKLQQRREEQAKVLPRERPQQTSLVRELELLQCSGRRLGKLMVPLLGITLQSDEINVLCQYENQPFPCLCYYDNFLVSM